jgi:hypothetical protein
VSGAVSGDDCTVPESAGTDRALPSHGQPAAGVSTVAGAAIVVAGEQASIGAQMGAATAAGMATAWLYAVGEWPKTVWNFQASNRRIESQHCWQPALEASTAAAALA